MNQQKRDDFMNLPQIIYEDDILLIVKKPAGMPTQSSEKFKGIDLYSYLKDSCPKNLGPKSYLALHHRLDAATSGLVLFCKDKEYNKYVTDLFRDKIIEKKYLAVVDVLTPITGPSWSIHNKLIEYKFKHYKKAKSSQNGIEALTLFKVMRYSQDKKSALIECIPKTGRLHQIRVHLSEAGLPVQGDFHYNKNPGQKKLQLFAHSLSFPHPKDHQIKTFTLDLDQMELDFD